MNKALFVLPVLALAVLIAAFVVMQKRTPDGPLEGPGGILKKGESSTSAAESARLRAEVEKLRKDVEAARRRAEEAEARVTQLESGTVSAAADPKKASARKGDWKKRRDAELEAKVKSMAWRRNVKSVIDYWKELEKARAEGRAPQMTPELMSTLNGLTADMNELSKFLGLEGGNSYEVFQNEVVGTAWQDAFFQEIGGGTITEDQLARLRATSLYDQDPDWDLSKGNILEQWKNLIERNRAYGTETAGILTPDQHALVAKAVTPTYMLSLYAQYGERTLSDAAAVTDYWLDSFKISADQRAAVEAVAAEFVRRQAEIASQYTGARTRDAEFDYLLKILEAQMAAEKRIAETVQVDPELASKMLKGSGALLKLAN